MTEARSETFSIRLSPSQKALLFERALAEGRTAGEVLLGRFFDTGGDAPASAPAAPLFSDDPDPTAGASGKGDAARRDSLDFSDRPQGVGVADGGAGPRPAAGDALEAARLEAAIWKELARVRLAPGVSPDALAAAVMAIARLDDDGQVILTVGSEEKPLRAALPLQLIAPSGGGGSGSVRPRALASTGVQETDVQRGVASQKFYEANRDKVRASELRDGLVVER